MNACRNLKNISVSAIILFASMDKKIRKNKKKRKHATACALLLAVFSDSKLPGTNKKC